MTATILVVDDDRGLRATLSAALGDEGYTVVTAFDGLDALEKLQTMSPALIVLDIGMPRMDGYALAEELDRRGLRPGIPLLVLTADGRAQEKAAQVRAEGWVSKPFSIDGLIEQVSRALGT
jgi:two-component system, chemotaxis family, chemotaxis protein CheY